MRISVYELPFATSIHVNTIRSVKEMIFQGIYSKQGLSSQEGVVKSLDLFSNQIQDDFPASWAVTQLVILRRGFFLLAKATWVNGYHELIFTTRLLMLKKGCFYLSWYILQLRCQREWWWDDSYSSACLHLNT